MKHLKRGKRKHKRRHTSRRRFRRHIVETLEERTLLAVDCLLPVARLDVTTFGGFETLVSSNAYRDFFGDDFVAVDPARSYVLSGQARSGNDVGGQYVAANRQFFGFSSYDLDQLRIDPWHVRQHAGATDTTLAVALQPGDTQIVLHDATGWANGGMAYERTLAWYGYTNSSGETYPDYTYTRNIARDFTNGLWNAGGMSGNVITLRAPWSGPTLAIGDAVRNTTSSGTYNYAAISATPGVQPVDDVYGESIRHRFGRHSVSSWDCVYQTDRADELPGCNG
jgi:hypothetical protein